jgi:hypothetical protein
MEVEYAILADGVTPRQDGKIDIFGAGVETVWAQQVPASHPQLALVLAFSISRHEAETPHAIDVIVMGADGQEIGRAHGDTPPLAPDQLDQVPAGHRILVKTVLVFANLTFPAFGLYHLAIHWDQNEARHPVVLAVAPPPVQEQ